MKPGICKLLCLLLSCNEVAYFTNLLSEMTTVNTCQCLSIIKDWVIHFGLIHPTMCVGSLLLQYILNFALMYALMLGAYVT